MTRVKVKGTGVRARSNPDAEPDFWQMRFVGATTHHDNDRTKVQAVAPAESTSSTILSLPPQQVIMDRSVSVVSHDSLEIHSTDNGCFACRNNGDEGSDCTSDEEVYESIRRTPNLFSSATNFVPSQVGIVQETVKYQEQQRVMLTGWDRPFYVLDAYEIPPFHEALALEPAATAFQDDAVRDHALKDLLNDDIVSIVSHPEPPSYL